MLLQITIFSSRKSFIKFLIEHFKTVSKPSKKENPFGIHLVKILADGGYRGTLGDWVANKFGWTVVTVSAVTQILPFSAPRFQPFKRDVPPGALWAVCRSLDWTVRCTIYPFWALRFLRLTAKVPQEPCGRGAVLWTGLFDALFTRFVH